MSLLSKIDERLNRRRSANGVLVAWSGGLDSTVLLHLLAAWSRRSGEAIAAVHVDHRLRDSSRADQQFCRATAHRWGIPLVVEELEVRRRGSMQESARIQRYAAISRAARGLGLGAVATAHHADDAVETALLNFRRGTSSAGLSSGISPTDRPIPSWPDFELIRPLVSASKRELLAYADAHDLAWRRDPTNDRASYERNRLRQQVLPTLTDDGGLLEPMIDTLENLASERRTIESMADDCLANATLERPDAESLVLDCEPLRAMPEAVLVAAIQKVVRQLPGEVGLARGHLRGLVDAILAPEHAQNMVPDTVRMAVRGGFVVIEHGLLIVEVARGRGGRHLNERVAQTIRLGHEHSVPWFGTRLRLDGLDARAEVDQSSMVSAVVAGVDASVVVRGTRPGDRLDARAMQGHKSVSDVLAEAGVPRALRWRWPVVARDAQSQDVEWICGLRRSELPAPKSDMSARAPNRSRVRISWDVNPRSIFARVLSPSQPPSQRR
jgi:tRNA(Ile)-lysidine synthase